MLVVVERGGAPGGEPAGAGVAAAPAPLVGGVEPWEALIDAYLEVREGGDTLLRGMREGKPRENRVKSLVFSAALSWETQLSRG